MSQSEKLIGGCFYHIYNRGINSENLFNGSQDYERFLRIYAKYIEPIAETYAWVLMPNHFHFLVKIKENIVYRYSKKDFPLKDKEIFDELKWETVELSDNVVGLQKKIPEPHLHFSHLFNAYSRTYNEVHERHGSLMEREFNRKLVHNHRYLKEVIRYIHHNPVHHGFCSHSMEYPWSSYLSCLTLKPTKLKREAVIAWFDDEANFKIYHDGKVEIEKLEKWLEI